MRSRTNLRSCFSVLFYVTIFDQLCDASSDTRTPLSDKSLDSSLRVAIVGAGIAGASAALHLHELSRSNPISITIYESEPLVGGRVLSVSAPEAPRVIVEAGSPNLSTDDECLTGGLESTGLRFSPLHPLTLPKRVGLWNGQGIETASSCNLESPKWTHLAQLIARYGFRNAWRLESPAWLHLPRLVVRYGISAWRFHRTVVSTSKQWETLGALQPFDDIGQALRDAGIGENIAFGPADTYLRELGISQRFLDEVVEPCTRARYSHNLESVSALSALMVATRAKYASAEGGNARLIERMIELSGAELHLNSTVVEIGSGTTHRYQLSVTSTPPTNSSSIVHAEYDIVILALPNFDGRIHLNITGRTTRTLAPQPSAEFHVTHLRTFATVSPTFFHSSLNASNLDNILTTARSSNILSTSRSDAYYFSSECLRDEDCDQFEDDNNMHRIVSRKPLTDSDLANLIGKQWRDGDSLADIDIRWVHRKAWSQALPNVSGDRNIGESGDIEIAEKLFHLGGTERMLSSVEMSCRMGRNVARLLGMPSTDDMETMSHSEL